MPELVQDATGNDLTYRIIGAAMIRVFVFHSWTAPTAR